MGVQSGIKTVHLRANYGLGPLALAQGVSCAQAGMQISTKVIFVIGYTQTRLLANC